MFAAASKDQDYSLCEKCISNNTIAATCGKLHTKQEESWKHDESQNGSSPLTLLFLVVAVIICHV